MGHFKDLKTVRKVILDTMRNVHPIYNIKELMIKRELLKQPELADEDWNRFMPKFKKRNVQRKKVVIKEKKEYTPFPPEQQLRKEDLAMMSGEYFLTKEQIREKAMEVKRDQREVKKNSKIDEKMKLFEAPTEDLPEKVNKRKAKEAAKE